MKFYLDLFEQEVPLVWFVEKEESAEIYICTNAGRVLEHGCSGVCQYVNFADQYRQEFGVGEVEKFIIVTDDTNVAKKVSYLFAGDVKNDYFVDEDGNVCCTKSEKDGVLMAELDVKSGRVKGGTFPEFSYNLDGALFLGAESEEDLKQAMDAVLSCTLPFTAVVINEKLFSTQTVKKLLFDYNFSHLDLRNLSVSVSEAKELLLKLEEAKREAEGSSGTKGDPKPLLSDKEIEALMADRGGAFREEDLIRYAEIAASDDIQQYLREEWGFNGTGTTLL